MIPAPVLQALRVLVALLGLSAVVTEVVVLVGRGTFVPGNFFSFFTIQSNLLAGVTLLLVVTRPGTPWLSWLRGLATLCMVVTGIVFSVLLSGLPADVLTAVPWDNVVLHYLVPIWFALDWLARAADPAGAVPQRACCGCSTRWRTSPTAWCAGRWPTGTRTRSSTRRTAATARSPSPRSASRSSSSRLTWLLTWWGARRAPDRIGREPSRAGGG